MQSLNYLLQKERPQLTQNHFHEDNVIFRIKKDRNPINLAYPQSMITELSCNWSKYIIPADIIKLKPTLGNYIFYSTVKDIRSLEIRKPKSENTNYDGLHILTCLINHAPLHNDYSHVHIDISHYVNSKQPLLDKTIIYDRSKWNANNNILRKKGSVKKFFKDIREDYKFQLACKFQELPEKRFHTPMHGFDNNSKNKSKCNLIEYLFGLFSKKT